MNRVPGAWNIGASLGISDSDAQILYFVGSLLFTALLVVVTIYYAWQNKRMADEMRRQNRPYVYVVWEKDVLKLHNSGSRSATNVRLTIVRDAYLSESIIRADGESRVIGIRKVSESQACRDGIAAILPGADRIIGEARGVDEFLVAEERHQQSLEYVLTYADGAGTTYQDAATEEWRS